MGTMAVMIGIYGLEAWLRPTGASDFPVLVEFVKWALGIVVVGNVGEWGSKAIGGALKNGKK